MTINPWDIPPLPKRGDSTKSITYEAVGLALSNWEFFEGFLGLAFRTLLRADERIAANRAFGTLNAFRSRTDMVEAAADAYFAIHRAPRVQADLQSLLNRAGKFGARRNEIAHGRVGQFKGKHGKHDGWGLYPSFLSTRKRELAGTRRKQVWEYIYIRNPVMRPRYVYTSAEINAFAASFWDLGLELGRLLPRIGELWLPPQARLALKHPEKLDAPLREALETRLQERVRQHQASRRKRKNIA